MTMKASALWLLPGLLIWCGGASGCASHETNGDDGSRIHGNQQGLDASMHDASMHDAAMHDASARDAGSAAMGCTRSGGNVVRMHCCGATVAFPNTCSIGACSCGPSASHEVDACSCPAGQCYDGTRCR